MLRWSSTTAGTPAHLGAVVGDTFDDLPHQRELAAFVDAAAGWDAETLATARARLEQASGWAFMVDTAAVVAAFEMFTRAVDGTGGRFDPATATARAPLDAELGMTGVTSAR